MKRLDARVLFSVFALASASPALAKKPVDSKTVVVLGDSRSDGCEGEKKTSECRKTDNGYDEKVLGQLLGLATLKEPDAVFFTGDLTLGLEKEEQDGTVDPGDTAASGGWAKDFEYDAKTFARMIADFKKTVSAKLKKVPFWPIVGNHDAVGPDALAQFRTVFGLEHPPNAFDDPQHLAYVVTVGSAAFVVLATDYYVDCPKDGPPSETCNLQEHRISPTQLAWLDDTLAGLHGFRLFVLGHEPAFSAGVVTSGLDEHPPARDQFWSVLQKHGVVAYLCSHQHRFDVSQHGGVWQIVSGGAGAPLDGHKKGTKAPLDECTGGVQVLDLVKDTSFFHYLLLRIPDDPALLPMAEIKDCRDRTRALVPLATYTPQLAPPRKPAVK